LLLLPPQSPNAIALSVAIAATVAIAHLFDTTIKRRWHGQWQLQRLSPLPTSLTPQSNGDGVGDGNGSNGYGNKGGG
jgi:hypothetical protein